MPVLWQKGAENRMGVTDREKVIKALECCATHDGEACSKCSYSMEETMPCFEALSNDALVLMKEQEEIIENYRLAVLYLAEH